MKKLVLERYTYGSSGTIGFLEIEEGEFACYTIERPWLGNRPDVSCIPEGVYPVILSRYNRGDYDCYEVLSVPRRTLIKFHIANTMDDLMGCIGPGLDVGRINGLPAVTDSSRAFGNFMDYMNGENGILHVKGTNHG